MPERERHYLLRFAAPVGIASGLGLAGLVDRAVVRDSTGLPVIPGSSVKGRLRFFAERLLLAGGAPEGLRQHDPARPLCKNREDACTVCRLFGNPSLPALLYVGPASLEEPWKTLLGELLAAGRNPVVRGDAEIRPGVALSRRSRTALPDHLFFDETVPATVSFAGRILVGGEPREEEERFLIGAGAMVDALGGRKAAGRGRLEGGIRIGRIGRSGESDA
jgi:CRISPR/Cas system CSM-associated protein Csm3 (group 7 of RAMP superfamily)